MGAGKEEAFLLTIDNPYEEASRESAINWIHELNRAANSLIGRTLSLNGDLTITAGNQKRTHTFQIKIRQSKVTYRELDGKSPEKHLWRGTRPGVQYFGRPHTRPTLDQTRRRHRDHPPQPETVTEANIAGRRCIASLSLTDL